MEILTPAIGYASRGNISPSINISRVDYDPIIDGRLDLLAAGQLSDKMAPYLMTISLSECPSLEDL